MWAARSWRSTRGLSTRRREAPPSPRPPPPPGTTPLVIPQIQVESLLLFSLLSSICLTCSLSLGYHLSLLSLSRSLSECVPRSCVIFSVQPWSNFGVWCTCEWAKIEILRSERIFTLTEIFLWNYFVTEDYRTNIFAWWTTWLWIYTNTTGVHGEEVVVALLHHSHVKSELLGLYTKNIYHIYHIYHYDQYTMTFRHVSV